MNYNYFISLHKFFSLHIICVLLFWGSNIEAQNQLNKQIIPQPPNVSSLLKFNEIPVTYFNGTADVSVPLFEVKEGANIPLTLNYHTGGIKVAEEASWVGLGWSLPLGGVIQEIIVGEPDYNSNIRNFAGDYSQAPKPWNALTYITDYSSYSSSNFIESGFCYLDNSNLVKSYYNNLRVSDSEGSSNFEYDLYSFSFGGSGGKFILDGDNGLCLDRQNIKFKITNRYNTNTDYNQPSSITSVNAGSSITATTPDGTQYIFGLVGYTLTPNPLRLLGSNPTMQDLKSRTWYLTKIIYTDKREIIFTYKKRTGRTLPTFNETWSIQQFINQTETSSRTLTTEYSVAESFYLDEIYFTTGKITFQTSDREDSENCLKLDRIQLFSWQNITMPIKEINFLYDYFIGSTYVYSDNWTDYGGTNLLTTPATGSVVWSPSLDIKSKRLRLNEIRITDPKAELGYIPYKFEYNSIPLPYKTSLAQDLWGFYNGERNFTLLPNYNNLGYWDSWLPSYFLNINPAIYNLASRNTNQSTILAGILTKVIYPTGGYSVFEFESNSFVSETTSNTVIIDAQKSATDNTTGIKQVEFDVPSINYSMSIFNPVSATYTTVDANPVNIKIELHCCSSPSGGCDALSGDYCNPNQINPNLPGKGLYVKLERLSNGQWRQDFDGGGIYSLQRTDILDQYNNINLNTGLIPGHYRIIANYPDGLPTPGVGAYTAQAQIVVNYKDKQVTTNNPMAYGGGLRIKGITEHNYDATIALRRNFTYSRGVLMTMPKFYRKYSHVNFANTNSANCSENTTSLSGNCPAGSVCPSIQCDCPVVNDANYSLSSNPVQSYSYSAKGALVGYDTVTVSYDTDGNRGKSEYIYYNLPDAYFHDAITLPGIPTSPNFLTGNLIQQNDYKKTTTTSFSIVKSSHYQYNLSAFDLKWCFKLEYMPVYRQKYTTVNCNGGQCQVIDNGVGISSGIEPGSVLLHFYPLKFGKMNLIKKIETRYEGTNFISTITNFEYNSQQQLRTATTTNTKNQTLVSETYYPSDYSTTSDITKEMRDRNMIDYPIESIEKIDGQTKIASYNEYYLHDNIVSLGGVLQFHTNTPTTFTNSVPANSKESRYKQDIQFVFNSVGNLQEQQKSNDAKSVYLYGYNSIYPVAEIKNTSFGEVLTAMGMNETQYNTEAGANGLSSNYITKIGLLRQNLPNALITTYTYEPLIGIKTATDVNGVTTYYEYDNFQRLRYIKDHAGNIVKTFDYKYKGQ